MKKEEGLTQSKDENLTNKELRKKLAKNTSVKVGTKKWVWPLKVFVLSISLSLVFTISSEYLMSVTGLVLSIFVVLFLVAISVMFDVIGVSVTIATIEPFNSMSARKIKGAKEALVLVKNADKVSVICNDIIGDICGIVSGAAGAAIVARVTVAITNQNLSILIMALTTALIAGITISGKSLGKMVAINNSEKIVLQIGKLLSPLWKKQKQDK